MFTRNRLPQFRLSGDWEKDGPQLVKWINDYVNSLEQKGAIVITEASLDGTPVGAGDADTGKFTTLEVTTSSIFPAGLDNAPTITAGTGTFTTVSGTVTYISVGNRCLFTANVTITTNGTAATDVRVTMPFSAAENTGVSGQTSAGLGLTAVVSTTGVLQIFKYDGTYPGADGLTLRISGSFRKA